MDVFVLQGWVSLAIQLVLIALAIFAFVDSAMHPAEAYVAAGKWTKPAWMIVLGLAVVLQMTFVGGMILQLAFTVAALVYIVDVRPALSGLRRR